MEQPITDLLNLKVPDQLSFVTELLNATFPSGVSLLTLNESLLLAETIIQYSEPNSGNTIIKPVLQTYLFLHSHMYYLDNTTSSSALPLMRGDILFSEAMNKALQISSKLSSITLNTAGRAFDSCFRLINSESPEPEIVIDHKQNMLPSFLRFGLNYLLSDPLTSERAFNMGMAYMLFLDLAAYINTSERDNPAHHINFSYINALCKRSDHNSAIEKAASLIDMYCGKCISGTYRDDYLAEKAAKILGELLCLQKRSKLN